MSKDFLIGRRELLITLLATAGIGAQTPPLPPVRAVTRGPKFHWFGYYDKLEFDPTGRFLLGMEVGFENRSPTAGDSIRVGMVDLEDGDRWIDLGESRAWNWQQGCMLQWLPGSSEEVIWNDRENDQFVSHIVSVKTGRKRTLGAPVYGVSPDGLWAVCPDFRRLRDTRPGYGYDGIADPNHGEPAPRDAGIWKLDLTSGQVTLLLSIADLVKMPGGPPSTDSAKHWFNHLLVSPDSSRFILLHRWQNPNGPGRITRMFTVDKDGNDVFLLDSSGKTSHFIWRDPRHVLAWSSHPSGGPGFYLFEDKTGEAEQIGKGVMTEDGHVTYLPGQGWILCDTYPDAERNQKPYLFDVRNGRRHPLGYFHSPSGYTGEWRCDSHPRISADGTKVAIDSPHGGNGRQLYLIDIRGVTGPINRN